MHIKYIIAIVFIFQLNMLLFAQKNIKKYKFNVENPVRNTLDSLIYEGIMYEFMVEREYLNDSIFIEKNLLHHIDTFRVSPLKWEIKKNDKWVIFHSSIAFPDEIIKWSRYYLIPKSKYYSEGVLFYKYVLSIDKEGGVNNHPLIIHFNLNYGIVKIEYVDFTLVREPICW